MPMAKYMLNMFGALTFSLAPYDTTALTCGGVFLHSCLTLLGGARFTPLNEPPSADFTGEKNHSSPSFSYLREHNKF